MLTFTPNRQFLLVANEGEPSGYGAGHADPEGSVSVIDIKGGVKKLTQDDVRTAGFGGVAVPAGSACSGRERRRWQDREPE